MIKEDTGEKPIDEMTDNEKAKHFAKESRVRAQSFIKCLKWTFGFAPKMARNFDELEPILAKEPELKDEEEDEEDGDGKDDPFAEYDDEA